MFNSLDKPWMKGIKDLERVDYSDLPDLHNVMHDMRQQLRGGVAIYDGELALMTDLAQGTSRIQYVIEDIDGNTRTLAYPDDDVVIYLPILEPGYFMLDNSLCYASRRTRRQWKKAFSRSNWTVTLTCNAVDREHLNSFNTLRTFNKLTRVEYTDFSEDLIALAEDRANFGNLFQILAPYLAVGKVTPYKWPLIFCNDDTVGAIKPDGTAVLSSTKLGSRPQVEDFFEVSEVR